jgi:hypothetical protein
LALTTEPVELGKTNSVTINVDVIAKTSSASRLTGAIVIAIGAARLLCT